MVPEVLVAGRFGPSRDAALITPVPDGLALPEAGIARGALVHLQRSALDPLTVARICA